MTVTSTLSNRFKFQLASGNIDFDADTFKIALMSGEAFTFDKDAHHTFANVLAYEPAAAGSGYNKSGETLGAVIVTEDDSNDRCQISWPTSSWTSSGEIKAKAAIIYDDSVAGDTIVGCVDFGQEYTVNTGSSLRIENIIVRLT